jgi:hypothetical protein
MEPERDRAENSKGQSPRKEAGIGTTRSRRNSHSSLPLVNQIAGRASGKEAAEEGGLLLLVIPP